MAQVDKYPSATSADATSKPIYHHQPMSFLIPFNICRSEPSVRRGDGRALLAGRTHLSWAFHGRGWRVRHVQLGAFPSIVVVGVVRCATSAMERSGWGGRAGWSGV